MELTFVNDAPRDEITEDDLKDVYQEGYIAGLYSAIEIIEAQIEAHATTRQ